MDQNQEKHTPDTEVHGMDSKDSTKDMNGVKPAETNVEKLTGNAAQAAKRAAQAEGRVWKRSGNAQKPAEQAGKKDEAGDRTDEIGETLNPIFYDEERLSHMSASEILSMAGNVEIIDLMKEDEETESEDASWVPAPTPSAAEPKKKQPADRAEQRELFKEEKMLGDDLNIEWIPRLKQWPIKIHQMAPKAPFYDGADLVIAADCTAYMYAAMQEKFLGDHIFMIGCPKLEAQSYLIKLTQIFVENMVHSVTVVRMDMPCCEELETVTATAVKTCGKKLPMQVIRINREGQIVEQDEEETEKK